jgi:DNA-binding transcriptional LysR family regulator
MRGSRDDDLRRPLNARQIEAFRAVMVTGGMTPASEMMFVSQPAVSRLIRDLEADLGLVLFQRKGNRIAPTEEAVVLFRDVERFFAGSEQLRETAAAIRSSREHRVRIAAMPSLVLGFIPRLMTLFLKRYPDINIFLHSDTSVAIADLVAKRHYDVGFAFAAPDQSRLEVDPLPETEAVCILHVGHPLARARKVRADDLEGVTVINLGPDSLLHMQILSVLRGACPSFMPRIEVRYPWSACAMVAEGVGAAIIDPFTAYGIQDERIVCRPFRPRIPFAFATLFPPGTDRASPAGEFAALFRKIMEREFCLAASIPARDETLLALSSDREAM